MVSKIIGVVAGYLAMLVFMFIAFTIIFALLGADRAFMPGTYQVSAVWIIFTFIVALIAGIDGGWICTLISKNRKTALILAAIVLILGLALAIPKLGSSANDLQVRVGHVSNMAAMQNARNPGFVLLLNPLIGALGIFLGSLMAKEKK